MNYTGKRRRCNACVRQQADEEEEMAKESSQAVQQKVMEGGKSDIFIDFNCFFVDFQ